MAASLTRFNLKTPFLFPKIPPVCTGESINFPFQKSEDYTRYMIPSAQIYVKLETPFALRIYKMFATMLHNLLHSSF